MLATRNNELNVEIREMKKKLEEERSTNRAMQKFNEDNKQLLQEATRNFNHLQVLVGQLTKERDYNRDTMAQQQAALAASQSQSAALQRQLADCQKEIDVLGVGIYIFLFFDFNLLFLFKASLHGRQAA